MPVEQVRQDVARTVLARELARRLRHIREQSRAQLGYPRIALGDLCARLIGRRHRTRHVRAAGDCFLPHALQPVAKAKRRDAVVAIVSLHHVAHLTREIGRSPEPQRLLHHRKALVGAAEVDVAGETVERLQSLDGVALHAGPHCLSHDGIEIDEAATAQQTVQFLPARRITTHQALERRWLVGRVVVNVHRRVVAQGLHDQVNDLFERRTLLALVERPPAEVVRVPIGAGTDQTEEVLASALLIWPSVGFAADREVVAFEVEKQIARRRLGQTAQPFSDRDLAQFVQWRRPSARVELHPRLLAYAVVRLHRSTTRPERERHRQPGELRERGDAPALQFPPLQSRDPGYEREMIVGATLFPALRIPRAHLAVLDGIGVVGGEYRRVLIGDSIGHLAADEAEVGSEVVDAKRMDRRERVRRDDVEVLGARSLDSRQHLRVEAELQNRPGAGVARQLGVRDLVRPLAKVAATFHPPENVRVAEPPAVA